MDNFLLAKQVYEIPFSWEEIRNMPIKTVKYIYESARKRYEKKMEAMNK